MPCKYTHGNDEYKSEYMVEWVSANVKMLTFTGTIRISKYPIGNAGGFHASPVVAIEANGSRLVEIHFDQYDTGKKEMSFEVELDSGGSFKPVANVFGYDGFSSRETYLYEDSDIVSACSVEYGDSLVAEEPPDISSVGIEDFNATSDENGIISVTGTIVNVVESGDGETVDGHATISVDGSSVTAIDSSLGPSEEREFDVLVTNVVSGEREVCVGWE